MTLQRLTYRQKLLVKKSARIALISLAVLLVGLWLFIIFVERYVVYTAEGVKIDYSRSVQKLAVPEPEPTSPKAQIEVQIRYEQALPESDALDSFKGIFVSNTQLQYELEAVSEQLLSYDSKQTILLELKDRHGYFYYNTKISAAETAEMDTAAVSRLISQLRKKGHTLIALVPAFSDYSFALQNISSSLALEDGILWVNDNYCYWLDPASETVMDYLHQIARELSSMGFSEGVFEEFYFPEAPEIVYSSKLSREQVIAQAAQRLSEFFTGSHLTISFVTDRTDFSTEALRGRLYIEDIDVTQLDSYAKAYAALDPKTQLVFFTDSVDSRFDRFCTLAPFVE